MQKEKKTENETDTENEDLKKQYHPAFCNAMMQILEQEPGKYEYDHEFSLNTLPNQIDFLVIRKDKETALENGNLESVPKSGIGRLFKTHNLFEYKSPRQALGLDEYHKMMGYAHQYVYLKKGADYEEVTLSFVRKEKPTKLMKYFKEHGFIINKAEGGIYHVLKEGHADMQIIVTRELGDHYLWLKVLTSGLAKEEAIKLSEAAARENDPESKKRITTILDLVSKLNQNQPWMEEWKMGFFKEYEKTIKEYQDQCTMYQDQCTMYQDQCTMYQDQCTMYQDQCAEKDKQIKSLNEELNSKDEELNSKNAELNSKNEEISRLAQELEKYRKLFGKGIAAL